MKEPTYRIENGRKLYRMDVRIDAQRRPVPNLPPPDINLAKVQNTNGLPQEQTPAPVAAAGEDPDIVRMRFRLISTVDAYPTKGWLGPQHVDFGHLNGQAIREAEGLINNAPRPVPLMWNHTDDITMKVGHIENAAWEDSKDIRPGLNGDLVVRRGYDAKAAFGLETGVLDATSIALGGEYELSHPELSFSQFVEAAGEGRVINGKPVMWLPVHTSEVYHHALVWSGADPNSGPRGVANARATIPAATNKTETAALAAQNDTRGGITMGNAIKILDSLCKDLGFDVILSEGAPIPEGLEAKVSKRLGDMKNGTARYNEIAARLTEAWEKLPDKAEGKVSALQMIEAMEARMGLATFGEKYVSDLREQALNAFDGAKSDPAKKAEQSLEDKTIRSVIAGSSDVEQLKAWAAEYNAQKAKKFGPQGDQKTSVTEELPGVTQAELTAEQRRIQASMKQWEGDK